MAWRAVKFDYKEVERLATLGLACINIALMCGIDLRTLRAHIEKDQKLINAINRGWERWRLAQEKLLGGAHG